MGYHTIEEILDWPLPPGPKALLVALAHRHNDRTGKCYPGIDDLAKFTGMGRRTVIRQMKVLEAAGAVVVRRKIGVVNHYEPVPYAVTSAKMAPVSNQDVTGDNGGKNQCQSLAPEEKNRKKDKSAAPSPWRGEASRLLEQVTKTRKPAYDDEQLLRAAANGDELAWKRFNRSTEGATRRFRKETA